MLKVRFNQKQAMKLYQYYPDRLGIYPFRNESGVYSFMIVEQNNGVDGQTLYTHKEFEFRAELEAVDQASKALHLAADMMITMSN